MTPKRDWKPAFIEVLRETGNVTLAAQHAGQSRNQVHDVRQRSKRFAAQWDDALEEATDLLEAEAWRRAFTGIDKPMFFKGEVVASIKKLLGSAVDVPPRGIRPGDVRRRRQGRAARRH